MREQKLKLTFIILLYLEIIYHLFTFKSLDITSFLYITIFTLFTSLFIDLITNLFMHKNNRRSFLIIITFLTILFITQFINYLFYGNIISIYSLFNGGQVFEFFGQIVSVIKSNIFPIILLLIPIILLLTIKKHILIFDINYKNIAYKFGSLILVYVVCILSLNFDQKDIYSATNLYYNKHVPNQSVQLLGLMTTMRLDVKRTISGFEESVTVGFTSSGEPIAEEVVYNITDIDFSSLIASQSNKTINNIHQYISGTPASKQNEYTGYFKDKNLIYITAEAFSPIAVDPILTPTLYKLVNTGFRFNNFYTPVYYVSTSDGEYVTLTSLLPKESVWSMSKSSSNYLPYTYGNVFSDLGYITNAYHNGEYKYYNRHKSHPNMGYKYMGCGNGLQKLMNCKQWPQSDLEMINGTFDLYSDNEKFMTYFMSISGHLEYNFFGNNMAYKNRKLVADMPYSNAIKAYMATQIELDKALESLISKLDAKGILDDTVIVLSADHYPYGLKTNEMKEVMMIEDEKFDSHKNFLAIWNNTMTENIEIDKYAMSLDILPTVLNLFGIQFDSRLLMGRDILSDSDGLVIFNDRSWITEYGKYNAAKNIFTPFKDSIPENYIEEINNIVYNKYVISKNILETNYYKHVFGGNTNGH